MLEQGLPAVLAASLEQSFDRMASRLSEADFDWYRQRRDCPRLSKLLAASAAAADYCQRWPTLLPALEQEGALERSYSEEDWQQAVAGVDVDDLDNSLRLFRHRHWLRIVYRDLNRLADTEETTRDLSALADHCIALAVDVHHRRLAESWGEPSSRDGQLQRMLVLGMGKLGACELNLSSDIDLIFAYPESGQTSNGRDNSEFFLRLGQRVIKTLDQQTGHGFVFRVDMRLRPWGQSGPLVLNFDALEDYYQNQGREWERYAMIKARCIAGDQADRERLVAMLTPFVFRRYVDYSVIDALRDMKELIRREEHRRGLQQDIKLGPGGIREVEFIAQCFQLIRGGQEAPLRQRGLRDILAALPGLGLMPEAATAELQEAYDFLRDTEHAIQAWRDQQTQKLPGDEQGQVILAWAMGFDDWQAFERRLQHYRGQVSRHFEEVIADPREQMAVSEIDNSWRALLEAEDQTALREACAEAGFDQLDEMLRRLDALLNGSAVARLQEQGRERLQRFMPLLMQAASELPEAGTAVLRVLPLVEAVLRRSSYLVLLMENPATLNRLLQLCALSPWIANLLANHPILLDELLDTAKLYHVPERAELRSELYQQILRIAEDDVEAQMDALRYFKMAHSLRVAVAEVTGGLPLMRASDYLSVIAEVLVNQVLELAWDHLADKHGEPDCEGRPFVVLAYGKLGGLELGHGSDLDLVFVHDAPSGYTDGERAIDNQMFFTRLGQRMIHILTARTHLGDLYEIDMRLRPSGNSGLLVSAFSAFVAYQHKEAWTWEHQALVRARVIAGDTGLADRVTGLRSEILALRRDNAELASEVVKMREKMREHLLPAAMKGQKSEQIHLKHSPGAIVDIEFMVQYAVLAWAHCQPGLCRYTDNIRILESLLDAGLLSEADAEALIVAYQVFRSHYHRLSLQQQAAEVPAELVSKELAVVQRCWQQIMADAVG